MVNIAINTLITAICLTITASSFYCPRPVKRKQALLESNLPGITGNKMSWINGAWPMSCAPAHHFGSCLKKLKKQSAILGYYRVFIHFLTVRSTLNLSEANLNRFAKRTLNWRLGASQRLRSKPEPLTNIHHPKILNQMR